MLKFSTYYRGDAIDPIAADQKALEQCPEGYIIVTIEWGIWSQDTIAYAGTVRYDTYWEISGTVLCEKQKP